jgi:hypothetical protein
MNAQEYWSKLKKDAQKKGDNHGVGYWKKLADNVNAQLTAAATMTDRKFWCKRLVECSMGLHRATIKSNEA